MHLIRPRSPIDAPPMTTLSFHKSYAPYIPAC
jgi:hypothetical protein